jgi:hypothetical protein
MPKKRKCLKCTKVKPLEDFSPQKEGRFGRTSRCKECRNIDHSAYYAANRHVFQTDARRKAAAELARTRRWNLRSEVIREYGGQCACCGESSMEFLVIDHIAGGGEQHRLSLGCVTGGTPFYSTLKRLGFPFKKDLRVLCSNCNTALGLYGCCPHRPRDKRPRATYTPRSTR